MATLASPKLVLLLTGKRKSGKDYVANTMMDILQRNGMRVGRAAISDSLKKEYAELNGIDFEALLTSGSYKERYRKEMIEFGEEKRKQDPSYFCRLAINEAESSHDNVQMILITDIRRESDLVAFRQMYESSSTTLMCVRVVAPLEVRESRCFVFTPGIDDAPSECGLDDVCIDNEFENSGDKMKFLESLESLLKTVEEAVS